MLWWREVAAVCEEFISQISKLSFKYQEGKLSGEKVRSKNVD